MQKVVGISKVITPPNNKKYGIKYDIILSKKVGEWYYENRYFIFK